MRRSVDSTPFKQILRDSVTATPEDKWDHACSCVSRRSRLEHCSCKASVHVHFRAGPLYYDLRMPRMIWSLACVKTAVLPITVAFNACAKMTCLNCGATMGHLLKYDTRFWTHLCPRGVSNNLPRLAPATPNNPQPLRRSLCRRLERARAFATGRCQRPDAFAAAAL
jgi:hypothetical protein